VSPAHVHEPTYAAIKQRLLAGEWPPGSRLESARIADETGVSMTPVRDSLNRLVGERLVDLQPGFGFHVPHLGALELRELLDLNLALLRMAIRKVNRPIPLQVCTDAADAALKTAWLFSAIARSCGNQALEDAIDALNSRLHALRRTEHKVLSDTGSELQFLEDTCKLRKLRELEPALRHYHTRRSRAAPQLLAVFEHTATDRRPGA